MQITRRDFLLAGGLAAAGTAIGKPTRSSIGVRQLTELDDGQGGYTASSYIQDGLVAFYDGTENYGFGKHTTISTKWKDLIGVNDISLDTAGQIINDQSITFLPNGKGGTLSSSISSVYSLDFCLSVSRSNEAAVFTPIDNQRMVWYYNGTLGCGYGKKGFRCSINTPCTIYADGVGSSFSAKAKNGAIYSPDGVSDTFSFINRVGFSFRETGFPFGGEVFRMAIYSRALSAEEIAYNYMIDKARFNLP